MARPKGSLNKATKDVRAAIALIAQGNVANVEKWLKQVEDPAKRVSLFLDMCEYHIPKLQRMELTGEGGGPLVVSATQTDQKL